MKVIESVQRCTECPLAPRGSAEALDEELPVTFESANGQKQMDENKENIGTTEK